MRKAFGHWLRKWADRIDYRGAPRALGYRFTFEDGEGIRFRKDGKGCRLWYLGMDDYEKAHDEADSAAVAIPARPELETGAVGARRHRRWPGRRRWWPLLAFRRRPRSGEALMPRWLAGLLAVETQEAMRRYTRLRPIAHGMPKPRVQLTESGWVATVPAPDWRYPPEWRV